MKSSTKVDFEKDIKNYYLTEISTINELDFNQINVSMNAILNAYYRDATIYVFGNGGSSATASHMVCDFNKGVCNDFDKKFNFVCLNDNIPLLMAISNDISFEDVFYYQLKNKLKKTDLIIAISGSGNSLNVIKAVQYAKIIQTPIIAVTGFSGGKLSKLANYQMNVPINDMQITEDLHMSFDHMIMKIIKDHLAKNELDNSKKLNKTKL